MRDTRLPYLAFAVCSLIWGSTFLAIRIGNDSLAPIWSLILRLVVAAVLLIGLVLITKQRFPHGKGLWHAILYGVLEFGLSMPMLYFAERTISSGMAALLFATCPLSAMFFGALFGTERLNVAKAITGVIGIGGLAILFGGEARGGALIGLLAALGAATTAVLGNVALQKGPEQSALGVNAVASTVGVALCLPLSFALGEAWRLPKRGPELGSVLYLAVAGSVVAFSLAVWLLGRWKSSTVSYLGIVCPMIAVALGAIVRHEPLGGNVLLGGGIVLASVLAAFRIEGRETAAVG